MGKRCGSAICRRRNAYLFRDGGVMPTLSRLIDLTWDWMDQAMAEDAMYGARG